MSDADFSSTRYLNEKAIREHALRCSAKFRAGKFTRVGQDFIDEVKADLESLIRHLANTAPVTVNWPLPVEQNVVFATGALLEYLRPKLDEVVSRIIQNKVQAQPSCGCTLSRTR